MLTSPVLIQMAARLGITPAHRTASHPGQTIRLRRYEAMTTAPASGPGPIAVITGGAGAIGTAITKALQKTGHRTVVLDRDTDIACDLGSELGLISSH